MSCIYTALGFYQFYTDFPQNFYINALRVSLSQVVLGSSTFTSIPYSRVTLTFMRRSANS